MNRKEFEKKQANKPLKLETRLLAERLGGVKHQIDALQLIEKTFEAELGATSTNMCIVEIMPEGEKPPLTEFFNTTDKSVLYPRLVQYCLENAQELPKDKRERACSHLEAFMEVFTKQTENAPEPTETPPEPQQTPTAQQPTRGKGRPKETFRDKMIDDADGKKLAKMHTIMRGKKGKDFSLLILACIKKGWITRPTYTQAANEFGEIGSKTGFNRYLDERTFGEKEIMGAINSLD